MGYGTQKYNHLIDTICATAWTLNMSPWKFTEEINEHRARPLLPLFFPKVQIEMVHVV